MTSLPRFLKSRRILAIFTSLVILGAFVQVGVANEAPQGQDIGPQVLTGVNGGNVRQVIAVGETSVVLRTATPWAVVPGAVININAPGPHFLLARFAAESACYNSTAGWCSVRIMVNGSQMHPQSGINFAFDSHNLGAQTAQSWEGHAMERFTKCLPAGNYQVVVEWASRQTGAAAIPTFSLDDYTLVVEQVSGCTLGGQD